MYNIYSIVILILFDIPRFSVNDLHQIQVAAPSPSSRKFVHYEACKQPHVTCTYSGKMSLIVYVSAPHNSDKHTSLNELINKEEYSLSYVKLDDAIQGILDRGQGSWLCKTDIVDAFKQIPIHPSLCHLYGVKWNGEYFFYTRLVLTSFHKRFVG